MLAKHSLPLAGANAGKGNTIRVSDMLRRIFKPLYEKKQTAHPSMEVRNTLRCKEETLWEICEMARWSMFNR